MCRESLGNNSGILRHHCCGSLWGEYVKTSTYFYLISCVFIGYRSLSSCLVCILQVYHYVTHSAYALLFGTVTGCWCSYSLLSVNCWRCTFGNCGTFVVTHLVCFARLVSSMREMLYTANLSTWFTLSLQDQWCAVCSFASRYCSIIRFSLNYVVTSDHHLCLAVSVCQYLFVFLALYIQRVICRF